MSAAVAHTGRQPRRAAARLALLVVATFLALAAGELGLRLTGFSWTLGPEQVRFGWPASLTSLAHRYRTDPDLFWFRSSYDADLAAVRSSGRPPTFVFLGDSCTEFSDFPARMLRIAAREGGREDWTALALGNAGWSSHQGLALLRREVAPLRPRVVLAYFGWNDHWLAFGADDARLGRWFGGRGFLRSSRLVQAARRAWLAQSRRHGPAGARVPLPSFRDNLRQMARLTREVGGSPVLLTAPSHHRRGAEPRFLDREFLTRLDDLIPLHQRYVEAVREVAREEQAVLCDLAAELEALPPQERAPLFRADGIHLRGPGHRRVARLLHTCLERAGVLARL